MKCIFFYIFVGRGEGEYNIFFVGCYIFLFDFGFLDVLFLLFEGFWGYVWYFINFILD